MVERQDAEAPVEAREVPVGTSGPMLTRTWVRGEPVVEVYTGGRWRPAHLLQRQDRADGLIVYGVTIAAGSSTTYRAYVWDTRAIRPVRPATAEPTQRTWP